MKSKIRCLSALFVLLVQMKEVNVSVTVEVLKDRKHMSAMEKMAEQNDPAFSRILDFCQESLTT